jgi:hypothetical protein
LNKKEEPFDRETTWTFLACCDERRVGRKNMHSSSGCATTKTTLREAKLTFFVLRFRENAQQQQMVTAKKKNVNIGS